ncbi:MAG: hypothetical protein BGO98_14950 [Myxococcales bacterium 68-20]|nr:hypothetical protein [Myxococcales bacterium]OJY31370.1 MAG: hypothetical protein BGO98_14950 [Myxococcales bacterium 68-20]
MIDDSKGARRARLRHTLVKAGREERAPDALRSRLLEIAAASSVTTAAAASSAAQPPANGGAVTAAKMTASWKMLGAVVALGALAATSIVVRTVTETPPPPEPVATAPQSVSAGPPVIEPTTPPEPEPAPIAKVEALPSPPRPTPSAKAEAVRAPVVAAAAPAAPSAREEPPSTSPPLNATRLGDEMKRVEAIRSAASAGRPGEALRLLEEYRTEFPSGVLSEETEVLRVESLARLGRTRAAAQLARRFLAERPRSPYASRIQATLATLPEVTPEE